MKAVLQVSDPLGTVGEVLFLQEPYLSWKRDAAGIWNATPLCAGIVWAAVEVEVPGPVSVVVPPTALELKHEVVLPDYITHLEHNW